MSVRHRGRAQQQHTQKLVLQGIKQTTLEALGGAFSCFCVVLFCNYLIIAVEFIYSGSIAICRDNVQDILVRYWIQ